MGYFLEDVAKGLLSDYGPQLNRHCLVFPNLRAGLFMMRHLASISPEPLWAPGRTTIKELFLSASPLRLAGTERMVFELFKLYRDKSGKDESVDSFYFWGEMLLNDFDDVDKHLVDARDLFTNIKDLHEIDDKFGGLTPGQIAIIKRFFNNFRKGGDSGQKKDFEFNWSLLMGLYDSLKELLRKNGLGYEGMINREVVESQNVVGKYFSVFDKYHFIGFNILNSCEKNLMTMLMKAGKAEFYWDYDSKNPFFSEDKRSYVFMEANIRDFGQSFHSQEPKSYPLPEIEIIDIPSNVGQAKLLPSVLKRMDVVGDDDGQLRTAVVLADENLLPSVLSSLPGEIRDINITMGYPFKTTVVYSLLRSLLTIQQTTNDSARVDRFGYYKVLPVLSNPLVIKATESISNDKIKLLTVNNKPIVRADFFDDEPLLKRIFGVTNCSISLLCLLREIFTAIAIKLDSSAEDENVVVDPLVSESLFRANQVLNRLEPLINENGQMIGKGMAITLIDRLFREIRIPFRGEPLRGLQVMGILESRGLDFDNLVVLSSNEGILPKTTISSSYIPYSLREAFGLPVMLHQDSLYAYYFNRLLVRARKVTLIYNSSSDGLRSGEMSRFLLRLKYGETVNPRFVSTHTNMGGSPLVPEVIQRREADIRRIEERYLFGAKRRPLSPSAINTWLNCSVRFYYKYICDIKEPEKIIDGIDPAKLGTLVHDVICEIYKPYRGEVVTSDLVGQLRKSKKKIREKIDNVIRILWSVCPSDTMIGNVLVVGDLAEIYIDKILRIDHSLAPFHIIALEESFRKSIYVPYNGESIEIFLEGKIDRIDEREGVRRLIDYKTGKAKMDLFEIGELFDTNGKNINDAATQALIYCAIMKGKEGYMRLRPAIYSLKSSSEIRYNDFFTVGKHQLLDYSTVEMDFISFLQDSLAGIFDREKPFVMTSDKNRCTYCSYKNICKKSIL